MPSCKIDFGIIFCKHTALNTMPQQTHAQLTRGILAVLAASPDIDKTPEELVEILVAGGHKMAKDKASKDGPARIASAYNLWFKDNSKAEKGAWELVSAQEKARYQLLANEFNAAEGRVAAEDAPPKAADAPKKASAWNKFCTQRRDAAKAAGLAKRTHIQNSEEWASFSDEQKAEFA